MIVKVYADRTDESPAIYAGNIAVTYNDDGLSDLTVYYGNEKAVWETAHLEISEDGETVQAYQEWETTDHA